MKKLTLLLALGATLLTGLASCHSEKDNYMKFVGDWGVRYIAYYETDYAGNPVNNTMDLSYYTPGDKVDGIDVVFRSNKTGMMIDRSKDTLFIQQSSDPNDIDTIPCIDTVIYRSFTFSYDEDAKLLYLNMEYVKTFSMSISNFSDTAFTYYNQYEPLTMEQARLVRLTDSPTRNAVKGGKKPNASWKPGSLRDFTL